MQNMVSPYIEEIVQGIAKNNVSNKIALNLNTILTSIFTKMANVLNLPNAETLKNINLENIGQAIATIGITLIIIFILCIVMYIFKSIGLYKMLKRDGDSLAWLSFVPFGCLYTIGKAVGKTKIYGIEINNPEYVLPALIISNMLPFMCGLSSFLFVLAFFGLIYRLYQNKTPNFAVVLTILSILLPPLIPFFIFAIRNK